VIWRLDILLLRMLDHYGPVWPVVTLLCLLYVVFARLSRSFVLGVAILLGAMLWYRPLVAVAHVLRWWIFAILAVRGTLHVLRMVRESRPVGRVPLPLILLGTLALVSCLWAANLTFSFVVAGTFVCTLVLCYVVAWRLMETDGFLRALCVGAVVLALSLQGMGCLLGAWALVTGDGWLIGRTGVGSRFSGVMHNANGNGVFGAVLWPIVLAAPRAYLGRLAGIRWLVLIALALAIVFSGSRTAAGVALMTTFVYALYRFRAGAVLTTGLVGCIGATMLLLTPLEELEGSAVDQVIVRSDTLDDLGGRMERWEMGWTTAQEKPVLGHGWGAARTLGDADVERSMALGRVKAATNLHSTHLSLLVDLGWVGLGLFWLFSARVVIAGMRILAAPPSPDATVSVLFFASTLGMLADTFVHNGVLSAGSPTAIVFWFSTAVVVKQSYRLADVEPEPAPESLESEAVGTLPVAGA
jgi:O-antigen ligase